MHEFTKKEREIFSFFDGKKQVFVDPAEIDHNFIQAKMTSNVDLDGIMSNMESDDYNIAYEATSKYVPFVHQVFGTKPLDRETGEGLTINETMDLMNSWFDWTERVKKNTDENPSSPTLSPDTPEPSEATNNTTECVQTSPESLESSLSP